MTDDIEDDDDELGAFELSILRKLGALCDNRRATAAELGKAMDASPERAKDWLDRLMHLGVVERAGALDKISFGLTSEGWKELERYGEVDSRQSAINRAIWHMKLAHQALRDAQLCELSYTDPDVPGESDPVLVTMKLRNIKRRQPAKKAGQ